MPQTADTGRDGHSAGTSVLSTPAGLRTTDLLSIGDLSAEEILLILDTAEAMQEVGTRAIKKVPAVIPAMVLQEPI